MSDGPGAEEGDALLGPTRLSRLASSDAMWIPVTIHLPLGLAKSWTPSCAEFSEYTPLLAVIFFAQLANTALVPVLPFMVKQSGADPIYYGYLQSAYWIAELVSAPLLGSTSDRIGRRAIIFGSLLVSSASHALLALSPGIYSMFIARTLCGFGFQLALCRAYFAETGARHSRASSFGLIGVITGVALTAGPTLGGVVGGSGNPHKSAWLACVLSAVAAVFALRWHPAEPVEKHVTRAAAQSWVRIDLTTAKGSAEGGGGAGRAAHHASGALEGGEGRAGGHGAAHEHANESDDGEHDEHAHAQHAAAAAAAGGRAPPPRVPAGGRRSRALCKLWRLNVWLARQGVYPLLLLNTAFRFTFSVYKTSFAFFCEEQFAYGAAEVGVALSLMGLLGIFVQGVLLRVVVRTCKDGNTLYLGLLSTAVGLALLANARSMPVLVLTLALITTGYGLAVPSLSALFSHVPMQQGVMQGIAGSADRLGQAVGPIAGLQLHGLVGARGIMELSGLGLMLVCTLCVQFIKDSDGVAISTSLVRASSMLVNRLGGALGGGLSARALGKGESGASVPPVSPMSAAPGLVAQANMHRAVSMRELESEAHATHHRPRPLVPTPLPPAVAAAVSRSAATCEHRHPTHGGGAHAGAPLPIPPPPPAASDRRGSIVFVRNGILDVSMSPFNTEIAEEIRLLRERSHSF